MPSRGPRSGRRPLAAALLAASLLTAAAPAAAAPAPLVLTPEADARVERDNPGTNFGSSTRLVADKSPVAESYLRFAVSGADAGVTRARLRLFVTDGSSNGPELYPSATAWSESAITWSTRPPRTGPKAADLGAAGAGAYVEFDVTSIVTRNGTFSFELLADSRDGVDFNSKEAGANPPQLVVELAGPPPADTTPPETTIDSGPSGTVADDSAAFTFSASEAVSGFACQLDGGGFSACSSPRTYSGLAEGPHTFAVRAADLAGNVDPTPATRSWTVDLTPPPPPPPVQGIIDTVAGVGSSGFSGDGGPATAARLSSPRTMAADAAGNLYVVDTENHRVRTVSPSGIITTIAGTGVAGFSGDGGPATQAQLNTPHGIDVDGAGNVYVADSPNHRIRRITPAGIITTLAGTGTSGYNGDGLPATSARLNYPKGVEVGPDGSLYVGDANNNRVRRIDASGTISTVAGTGTSGSAGDGGPATAAQLNKPRNLAFDGAGNLYIADDENFRVRRVDLSGVITTVAGTGVAGYGGDGGPATAAKLNRVRDVAVGPDGSLYIADELNHRIRRVDPSGIISTFAGTGTSGFGGDGGPATAAKLAGPRGVAVDAVGRILIGDTGNHRIRLVS